MFKRFIFSAYFYIFCSFFSLSLTAKTHHFQQNDNENTQVKDITATPANEAAQLETLDNFLTEIKAILQNNIFCIQQTEQVESKHKIKLTLSESKRIKQELQAIKQILQGIYQEMLISSTPEALEQSSRFIEAITIHLEDVFSDIKTISVQKLIIVLQNCSKEIIAIQGNPVDLQALEKRIKRTKQHAKKLIKKAEVLGLTWKNLAWRKVTDSKWTRRIVKAIIYGTMSLAAYTFVLGLYDQNCKIPCTNKVIGDLWRPFNLFRKNLDNPYYRKETIQNYEMAREKERTLTSTILSANSVLENPNTTPEVQAAANESLLKSMKEITELRDNPEPQIEFIQGSVKAISHFFPSSSILIGMCSPLFLFPQAAIDKLRSLFDTKQDFMQAQKWLESKHKNMIAALRGETTHKYIGASDLKNQENSLGVTTLDDMVGAEPLKEIALEIIDYIKNPKKYEQAGIQIESAILLHGPPQTGKTMFARALQAELERQIPDEKIRFFPVTSRDLEQLTIEEIFECAQSLAPCVVFLDEIDMIGASRNKPSPARTRQLLTSLSKIMEEKTAKKVFVIGATNEPENMDFALLVKGRFGLNIPIGYPTYKNRLTFIKRELHKRGVNNISSEFINRIAQETEGNSYNELSSIINDAFSRSMRELRQIVQDDFALAFDKQIRGIQPMMPLTDKELQIIATYQVGLGLMREILNTQSKVNCLTTCPVKLKIKYNESAMSFTETNSGKNKNSKLLEKDAKQLVTNGFTFTTRLGGNATFLSDEEIKNEILVFLAGQAALKLITGNYYSEYMKKHNAECLNMIKNFISKGEENSQDMIKEALETKAKYEKEALKLLAPHKETIEKLAQLLVEKKIIRAEEWEELIKDIFSEIKEELPVTATA